MQSKINNKISGDFRFNAEELTVFYYHLAFDISSKVEKSLQEKGIDLEKFTDLKQKMHSALIQSLDKSVMWDDDRFTLIPAKSLKKKRDAVVKKTED